MNRCLPHSPRPARLLAACCSALLLASPLPASAQQVPPSLGGVRNFPEAAQRGTLAVESTVSAQLNGKSIRMAPGMRLFSPQNSLVYLHTVIGKTYKVNYVVERSTGMLHAAWILSEGEAAQPRKGSDAVLSNYRAEYDASAAR